MKALTALKNAKVLSGGRLFDNATVVYEDGVVSEVIANGSETGMKDAVDLGGRYLTPGLCDIHIHGAGGAWAFSEDPEDILGVARTLARFGVTSFCPTTVSLPQKETLKAALSIKKAMEMQGNAVDFTGGAPPDGGARILGMNLEGPFISLEMPGAHFPAFIRSIDRAALDEILETAGAALKIATIAPELENGLETVEYLAGKGVVVSIGHTNCSVELALEAVKRGARLFTHLFNAMRPIHQRDPGVSAAAMVGSACFEIIADGIHVHPSLVRLAAGRGTVDRMILITDAILAAGIEEKSFRMFGYDATIQDGVAKLPSGTIAGSILTLNRAVANASRFAEISVETAVAAATRAPLRLLGLDGRAGAIEPGKAADMAVFDGDFNCAATIIGGRTVFNAGMAGL